MPLSTGPQYVKQLNAKRTEREPLERFWRDAYELTFPIRGEKFQSKGLDAASIRSAAYGEQAEIYDSTAIISTKLLVSAIMSGMFPAHVLWLGLEVRNNENKEIEEWLEETANTIWKNIHASNFDVVAFESLVDMIVSGMFGMFITEGSPESGQPYKFEQWPLHSLYCSDSTGDGIIDTVYREFKFTAEQAISTYGEGKLHTDITTAAKKKPNEKFDFLHVIHPNPDHNRLQLPIASVHISLKDKKIVRKDKGFHEMPVVVPRWFVMPDSVYATGPIDDALPDIKTVNELKKILLASGEFSYTGMWGVVDDGVLNPNTIKIKPRAVIPVANKDSIFPLSSGVDLNFGDLSVKDLQAQIKETLMSAQLPPLEGPTRTATEFHVRTQIIRQLLGPLYGRLQVEFLQQTIQRCFGIGLRAEAFNELPEGLVDKTATVKYLSPLAKAQKLETVGAIERFEAGLYAKAAAGKPEVLDIYKEDDGNRETGDMLGVPEKLFRTDDEVEGIRTRRAEKEAKALKDAQEQEIKKGVAPKLVAGGGA